MLSPNHPRFQHTSALAHANNERLDAIETKTDHITVTQPVALDTMESDILAHATKLAHVTVTQAVNLDTIESNVATNNAKVTYPSADAAKVAHLSVTQAVNLDAMETAVAAVPADTSARLAALEAKMQFQPKAFGRFTTIATPALLATSYNVASVSKTATGVYAVVIDTDMTTANYTIMLSYEDATATIQTIMSSDIATTGFTVGLRDASNALSDVSESVSFVVFENNT
jgi:hypothetical protein